MTLKSIFLFFTIAYIPVLAKPLTAAKRAVKTTGLIFKQKALAADFDKAETGPQGGSDKNNTPIIDFFGIDFHNNPTAISSSARYLFGASFC